MMKTYDVEHANIFPSHWKVNEMLANSFCEGTRDDFKAILQRSMRRGDGQTLDVDLLLSCLQETLDFENNLERRFSNEVSSLGEALISSSKFLVACVHGYNIIKRGKIPWIQSDYIRSIRAIYASVGRIARQVRNREIY